MGKFFRAVFIRPNDEVPKWSYKTHSNRPLQQKQPPPAAHSPRRKRQHTVGMSDKFLQTANGKRLFPPVRIGTRSVYFSDILDQQINKLALESGALQGGDA